MARMDTLEDMKRQKRNLDARLDSFEERLADIHNDVCLDSFEERLADIHNDVSLLNANVCTNRERIEVIEMTQHQDEKHAEDFIDVEGADWNGSEVDVKDEHKQS